MSRPPLHRRLLRVPRPSDKRLAVRVTPDALRHIRSGHPWVFEESVTSISHEAEAGDISVIFDSDRKFVALALYDPDSPIQFRILHVGKPTPIDADWWRSTIDAALVVRAPFTTAADADRLAYRVLNGENDGVSGLVVDRYAGVLVIKLYSAVWFPHLVPVVNALLDLTGCSGVVLRLARNLQTRETFGLVDGDVIAGDLPDGPVRFVEAGLEFDADVRAGQKTGHFLDQRANRIRVGEMSAGRDVLDIFASTGGFSVHAAAGGARSVHAVDLSAPTLAAAEHNMSLNAHLDAVRACAFTTEVGDAF
ncbi:MAG: class I SAM-dependent rRNA methyltransferase, partial [Acidobacteriota bacterium]